jgi:hypothetical protein
MESIAQQSLAAIETAFPASVQRGIMRLVIDKYAEVDSGVRRSYPPHAAHYLRGCLRRAELEVGISQVAERFGLLAFPRWNKKQSQAHMVLISCNVLLTISRASSPYQMIQHSEFRREYAREFQIPLFPFDIPSDPVDELLQDINVFGMILHGYDPSNKAHPSFIHIVVPDRECQTYIARKNLLRAFPDIIAREETREDEQESPLSIRRRLREEDPS